MNHKDKSIKYICISSDNVYMEYINMESVYISFTAAKKQLKEHQGVKIKFENIDHAKSVNFLNSLLGKFEIDDGFLKIRQKTNKNASRK